MGQPAEARRCLEALLRMKPNLQDVQMRQEVMVRTGRVVPPLRLQQHAATLMVALNRGTPGKP